VVVAAAVNCVVGFPDVIVAEVVDVVKGGFVGHSVTSFILMEICIGLFLECPSVFTSKRGRENQ
jgi:hypothetical protein